MRFKGLLLFFLIFPYLPFSLLAQRGSVEGVIINISTGEPVAYAGVTLHLAKDSTVVSGEMTDEQGKFLIRQVPNGIYLLQFQYFGIVQWYDKSLTVSNTNPSVKLDTLKFNGANLLEAAVITAQKPLFEIKHGTVAMNVEANPTAGGDNVIELLKKMPGLIVDQNDEISIEGKSGVVILIDDKPTYLSGEDLKGYLRSLPSNTVERIEVMKKPSARFDAQGNAGVINIIMKKENKLGINGSVFAGLGYSRNFREQAGFNLTARAGKFVFSGNYSLYNQKSSNSSQSEILYLRGGDTIRQTGNELDAERWGSASRWTGHNFSFSSDYFINKKNVVSLLYRGNINQSRSSGNSFTRLYTNSAIDSSYRSSTRNNSQSSNHTVNFNYKHSFDTAKTHDLHFDVIYSHNGRHSESNSFIDYYRDNLSGWYRQEVLASESDPSQTEIFTAKADYEYEINEDMKVEAGLKSSWVRNDNFNRMFRDGEPLPEMDNHFLYQENVNALYGIFSYTTPFSMDIQLGLRAEHTRTRGTQRTTGQSDTNQYFALFPNLSLSYKLPKENQLELSYRYSIYRPGYYNLNPFVNTLDPTEWSTGNPNLKPCYNHSLSLNWSWKYKIYVWLDYDHFKDETMDVTFLDPGLGVTLTRPENMGESDGLSFGTSVRVSPWKWWNMQYNLGLSLGQSRFDYVDKRVVKTIYGGWFYFNQSFTIAKNYFLELSGYGHPPMENRFGRNAGRITINAGARALFFNKKLSVRLSINDIFDNGSWKENYTYPNGMKTQGEWLWESRAVWLSCSYQFGKQDIKSRQLRGDSDELNRAGGGGGSSNGSGKP